MKDNKDLEETRSKPVVDPVRKGGPQRMNEGRRRIAKAGLLAPVVMTLASRPSWGANCTVSGMYSGNLSNPTDTCEGNSPAYWREQAINGGSWPSPYTSSTLFSPDSSQGVFESDSNYDSQTLLNVLGGPNSSDPTLDTLGAHTVAALLNAADPLINFGYEPADIIGFFNLYHISDPTGLREDFMMLNSRSGI